ncbi:CorA family divalent cation transporter [Bosea sp. AAP35]|uniref:CorA family divalent cation transporter n=1 Tax=Bosea sp. AAP35 TaxID=1523417 RepID=UPI0009EA517C|nr:CorA family divalent cation transporter [Bosea sp. AAP35]
MTSPLAIAADAQSRMGMVWAYRFDADGAPLLVERETVPPVDPAEGFVWIHLDLVHSRAKAWVAEQPWLPAEAEEMFISPESHQRLDHSADFVWGVSHDLVRDIAADTDRVGPLYWIVGARLLLTGRRDALQSTRLAAEALNRGEPVEDSVALFEQIIEYIIDDVTKAVVRLMEETDDVEDHVLQDRFDEAPARVGSVRRMAVRLSRQLGGLHLLFRRFAESNSGRKAPEAVKAAAGRLLQRIEGLHHDVQSVQDRARLLQDEMSARTASQTNRQLYALSILTALFMPATFITGLFGINVKGLPWMEQDLGAVFVALTCVTAALLTLILLRRRGVIGG